MVVERVSVQSKPRAVQTAWFAITGAVGECYDTPGSPCLTCSEGLWDCFAFVVGKHRQRAELSSENLHRPSDAMKSRP
jgi:hypothetical protein